MSPSPSTADRHWGANVSSWLVAAIVSLGILAVLKLMGQSPPPETPGEYVLPFPVGKSYKLVQGFNGPWGHEGPQAYALDFIMPIGSLVTAARGGVVVKVEQRYEDGNRIPGEENYVVVRHDDGTFGRYFHLTRDGALVEVGQRVRQGQELGLSGDTGASAAPHLHFDVTVSCPEWGCQTISVELSNCDDNPPVQGKVYRARRR